MKSENNPRPGPTGDYPQGKYTQHDEGGLKIAIGADLKAKRINVWFGKEISWIALGPEQARGLASLLIDHANDVDGQGGK